MKKSTRFMFVVPLLSVFTALSLSALAEEPKKPAPKPPAAQQKGPARPGPQVGSHPGLKGTRTTDIHRRIDPRHVDRQAWGRGRAYPYGCRWERCGYWWWADGYWYFYDQPFAGPPAVVSEVAYDEQGNPVPASEEGAPPVGGPPPQPVVISPVPPAIVIQRPPVCVAGVCF